MAQPLRLERSGAGIGGGSGDRQKHFEMLRMWRLIDELEIDEEQAIKVFPVYGRQRAHLDALEQNRRMVLAEVTQQLREDAEDDDLRVSIRKVRAAEEAIATSQEDFAKELASLLTVRQQARLLLFDANFRTDLVDIVRRMRNGGDVPLTEGVTRPGGGRGKPWEQ
ncbi:MAG: hypothetical protein O2782_03505 [bacterium]|nr:hypothetical protein [bacterium]